MVYVLCDSPAVPTTLSDPQDGLPHWFMFLCNPPAVPSTLSDPTLVYDLCDLPAVPTTLSDPQDGFPHWFMFWMIKFFLILIPNIEIGFIRSKISIDIQRSPVYNYDY